MITIFSLPLLFIIVAAIIVLAIVIAIAIGFKQTNQLYYTGSSYSGLSYSPDSHSPWDWRDLSEPAPSPAIGYTSHDNRSSWDCTGVHGTGSLLSSLRRRWLERSNGEESYAPGLKGEVKRVEGLNGGYKPVTDSVTRYLATAPSGDGKGRFVLAGDRLVFMTKTTTGGE